MFFDVSVRLSKIYSKGERGAVGQNFYIRISMGKKFSENCTSIAYYHKRFPVSQKKLLALQVNNSIFNPQK